MMNSNERVYVLDEGYKLILAPPPAPDDPINALYDATTAADALPPEIDRAVRTLTRGWDRDSAPAPASASVRGMKVLVAPLQGPFGPHFAVRVEGT
ncbi:MAG TPA: hypothetical protein VFE36_00015 [Candidatus Baltobacteraceae bacterium]|jgi:hypothetical protein|nr:hypothetical protein [Candidatus Baltobacteraceae bacterium]